MPDPAAGLPPRFLRTAEAARFLSLSGRTLEKHRTYGTGPTYRKIGGRVVYAVEDLKTWADRGTKTSTSDPGAGTVLPAKRHMAALPVPAARLAEKPARCGRDVQAAHPPRNHHRRQEIVAQERRHVRVGPVAQPALALTAVGPVHEGPEQRPRPRPDRQEHTLVLLVVAVAGQQELGDVAEPGVRAPDLPAVRVVDEVGPVLTERAQLRNEGFGALVHQAHGAAR